jgi:hypothetical protein
MFAYEAVTKQWLLYICLSRGRCPTTGLTATIWYSLVYAYGLYNGTAQIKPSYTKVLVVLGITYADQKTSVMLLIKY